MNVIGVFVFRLISAVLFAGILTACGGGSSSSPSSDTTPDSFNFEDADDVALSTVITSNTITISGIDEAVPISVIGGEYAIDGGSYTATAGLVSNGQDVQVRATSSSELTSSLTVTLDIGGLVSTFTITTLADITAPSATIQFPPPVSMTEGTTVTVRGTAADDLSSVASVQVNGVDVTDTSGNGSFSTWSVIVNLADGDNTLTVTTTDSAANSEPNATSVFVKRDATLGNFPDDQALMARPVALAIDKTGNRLFVGDGTTDTAYAIDLDTGVRSVFSDNSFENVSAPYMTPEGLLLDESRNTLWVMDAIARALFAVDLTTGEKRLLSNNTTPSANEIFDVPRELTFNVLNSNELLVTDGLNGLKFVDTVTGERQVFSSNTVPDTNNPFGDVLGIVYDSDRSRYLVGGQEETVMAIDPETGVRTVLTSITEPNADDPIISAQRTLVMDVERNRVLLVDNSSSVDEIIAVDLVTGVRSMFSDATTPNAFNVLLDPEEIVYDSDFGYAFVADDTYAGILAVDIETGERVFFSRGEQQF